MLLMCEGRVFARRNNGYQPTSKRRILGYQDLGARIVKMNIDFLMMDILVCSSWSIWQLATSQEKFTGMATKSRNGN
jgi:hypothetical protein